MSETSSPVEQANDSPASLWPDLSLLGVAIIWGVNIPLMKIGLGYLGNNVYLFNAMRLPVSAAALVFFALRERQNGNLPKPGVSWKHLLIYSAMVSACYQLLFLIGMDMTTPGNTALIIATVPMWTALLAWMFLGERIRRFAWCGLLIALLGTIVVAVQKGVSADSQHLLGNLAILASALLWSAGTVYSRPLLFKISPMQLAAIASVMALPVHIMVAASKSEGDLSALSSIPLWLIVIYSGLFSSGLSSRCGITA